MSKRVLVTGGSGLVGQAIRNVIEEERPLNEEWFFVGSSDADLTDINATQALFRKYNPTHVVHLAAMVGGLYHNMKDNLNFFRKNMLINDNVLLSSHEFSVKKVISCLSTCVFPDKTEYPINETMIFEGPPHSSNYGYSYAKRMVLVLNKAYYEKYGHMFMAGIPCNIYGPHDNFIPGDSHVIPGMIRRMYETIYLNDPQKPTEEKEFVVYGTGKPFRMFIFSRDLAKLFIWCIRNYESIDPVIFCPDISAEVTIAELAGLIAKAFNFKGKIIFDTTKSDGQIKKTSSNARLRSLVPDFQFTSLESGLNETVNWFIQNYDSARK